MRKGRLKKRGVRSDMIVSSDARRAVDTAASMAEIIGLSPKAIRQTPELYHGISDRILAVIHQFNDQWKRVMLVGHNPGFTEIANRFIPTPLPTFPPPALLN